MKKFLKWTGIVFGSILLLIVLIIVVILVRHDRYGMYPSGGVLSENQSKYDIIYYGLNLEVFSEDQAIAGYTDIKMRSLTDGFNAIELDLIDNFDVLKITDKQSNELKFEHDGDKLAIQLKNSVKSNEVIDLKIEYEGQPVEAIYPPWIGGFNWSKDSSGADWIGLSCQGEGAKIWFPCKDHPSDEPDSTAINITIPEPYYCASNGLLREISNPRKGYRTFHWITHYPINNYNINISIGKYVVLEKGYITESGESMPVFFYVLPQSLDGAEKHLDMAIDMLYTYRNYYGEYPFSKEKFAIVETDYYGMEHQTVNAYGNKYKYLKVNGVDWDWLMLHEMGHEWWGNKVTMNDWTDMWIHEGICTFGEALYHREKGGEKAYHDHLKTIRGRIANKKPIIPKKNANSQEVYHGDIYMKGAYLMHSLRYLLGDSIFFSTLKEFANDSAYTYQNRVVTNDFIELIGKNSKTNYKRFIEDFLYTTKLPEVIVDSLGTNSYTISIPNIDYQLPMDITTNSGRQRMFLGHNPITVETNIPPIIDEQHWFLKEGFKTTTKSN